MKFRLRPINRAWVHFVSHFIVASQVGYNTSKRTYLKLKISLIDFGPYFLEYKAVNVSKSFESLV